MASDQEMLDRIAQLTNAIELQKSRARGGYNGRGRGGYRPSPPPHASSFRPTHRATVPPSYRGRGGNMTLSNATPTVRPNLYNQRPVYNSANTHFMPVRPPAANRTNSHHRSLVLKGKPTTPYPNIPTTSKSKSHHRQLIINQKDSSSTNNTVVKSVDALTGRKQVAVDGVDFVVKGKKLIRKDLLDSNATMSNSMSSAPKVLVRRSMKRYCIGGMIKMDASLLIASVPFFFLWAIHQFKEKRQKQKYGDRKYTINQENIKTSNT